jgi:hypothetical protein
VQACRASIRGGSSADSAPAHSADCVFVGTVYFAEKMPEQIGGGFEGLRVGVSGSGDVAQYAVEKAMALGVRVVTVSDSSGTNRCRLTTQRPEKHRTLAYAPTSLRAYRHRPGSPCPCAHRPATAPNVRDVPEAPDVRQALAASETADS